MTEVVLAALGTENDVVVAEAHWAAEVDGLLDGASRSHFQLYDVLLFVDCSDGDMRRFIGFEFFLRDGGSGKV